MPILGFFQPVPIPIEPVYDVPEDLTFSLHRGDEVLVLDDEYQVQLGVQGLDGSSIDLSTTTPAGWDGDQVNDITAGAVEVYLPVLASGDSLEELRAVKNRLRTFTNPRRGPVRLRVTRPNNAYREIVGLRTRIVDPTLDESNWGVTWQKFGPVLHCSDPFWTEPNAPWHVEWEVRADTTSPLPILPLGPGASQALNNTNDVTVRGDVETYPVWKATGPFTAVTVRDEARGLQWTLTATAVAGETWTIDCRRGQQRVLNPAGVQSRGNLSADAYLWGLQPGVSKITTTVVGGSVGASVIGDAPTRWEAY